MKQRRRVLLSPGHQSEPPIPDTILEKWQKIVNLMAEMLDVPAGLIMRILGEDIHVFVSSSTEGNPYHPGDSEHFWGSDLYCEAVVTKNHELLVPNALFDEAWKNNPDVKLNMISYLGYPIRWPDGEPFGTICVLDCKTNTYSEKYRRLISQFRDMVEIHLEILHTEVKRREELERLVDERTASLQLVVAQQIDANNLLQGEQRLTEKIACGDTLQEILEEACKLVERALPGSFAVILLLDGDRLRRGAAPSLPKYIAEVDGFEIDPNVGTCSAAAARKEWVITSDITKDPNWACYLDVAAKHGLRSGWASPILSSTDAVLGTFALYWPDPRSPSHEHLQIIDQMVRLLAFAIQRKEDAEALQASEKLARSQAEALTLTLDALARETDPSRAMEHVLRTVTAQFEAHSCSVWLRDQVSGLMVFEFAFEDGVFKTKDEANLAAVSPSLAVEAIPTWVEMFRIQRPVVLEDIRIKPDFPWRAHLLALGVITMLAVPMVIAGKGEGLIGIRFTRKRDFSAEAQELAQVLANQAMLAIQMARLSIQSHHTAMVEERNRVARDIHDTLAQSFTGVIAHLEAARGAVSQKKTVKVSDHLERAGELAREGLREARRSVQALRPLALEEKPVTVALHDLIERMTAGMPMKAKLASKGEPVGLSQEWETNLLRIGQEILTNAIRHSQASAFDALLVFETSEILLDFRDNGRGFDPAKGYEGFGIRGIRERVNEMGGKFTIQSAEGKGTVISILLPLKSASALGDI